jgi:hypothetical protein
VTAPIVPDFREVFARCFEAIDAHPTGDTWHGTEFDANGVPYVHASNVSGCPRQFVLHAAGAESDGNTVDSSMNFALGNSLHKTLEDGLKYLDGFDGWTCLFSEHGLTHSKMALKGKADAILRAPSGQTVLFDLKSEAATSKTMREKQYADRVRPEHKLQCAAGALLAEDAGLVTERIETGMICYVSRQLGKNVWDFESIPFEITDALRAEVVECVTNRVEAWNKYRDTGEFPPALAKVFQYGKLAVPWMCNPRSAIDRRGKFCEFRTACAGCPFGVEL